MDRRLVVGYRGMFRTMVYRVQKSLLLLYVCSDKLPAIIFIGMGPNLDTCISEVSRGNFLDFLKF